MLVAIASALISLSAKGYRDRFPLPGPTFGQGWGVNIHFTHPAPGEVKRIRDAGFCWVRMDFVWSRIERTAGTYDFSDYDFLMKALDSQGIRPIFILDYGNDLYQQGSPRSPEARTGFCRFVAASLEHFKNRGIIWEMWNEPNIQFWQPAPNVEEYIALAKDVGETVRREAPDEWYVGPATSGFDWKFLEASFRAGLLKYWDAVTVHPYRASDPESVVGDWAKLFALIERFKPSGKSVPIISGEWGYSDINLKGGIRQQADYALRQYLVNLTCGVNLSIWYDWKDDGPDPKEPEHHFGLMSKDLVAKPGYVTASAFSKKLEGMKLLTRWNHFGLQNEFYLLFRGPNGSNTIDWTPIHIPIPIGPDGPANDDRSILSNRSGTPKIEFLLTGTERPQDLLGPSGGPPIATYSSGEDLMKAIPFKAYKGPVYYQLWTSDCSELLDKGELKAGDPPPASFKLRRSEPVLLWYGQLGLARIKVLVALNPIQLSMQPNQDGWSIRIDNPARTPFTGRLHWGDDKPKTPVTLRSDESVATIPVPDRLSPVQASLVEKRSGKDIAVAVLPAVRPVRLALNSGNVQWVGEGDSQSLFTGKVDFVLKGSGSVLQTAISLSYEFGAGWKYACLKPMESTSLDRDTTQLGYWVYGDGKGQALRMRFQDSTGQTFQPDYGPIDWKGWRWITFNLNGKAPGRWGGADDGVVHYPIRIETALLLDNVSKQPAKGEIAATGFTIFSYPRVPGG